MKKYILPKTILEIPSLCIGTALQLEPKVDTGMMEIRRSHLKGRTFGRLYNVRQLHPPLVCGLPPPINDGFPPECWARFFSWGSEFYKERGRKLQLNDMILRFSPVTVYDALQRKGLVTRPEWKYPSGIRGPAFVTFVSGASLGQNAGSVAFLGYREARQTRRPDVLSTRHLFPGMLMA